MAGTYTNKHGDFTPWVEKELGCSRKHATDLLLAIAELPSPDDDPKRGVHASFDTLNIDELAAAGRAVKKGVDPVAAGDCQPAFA